MPVFRLAAVAALLLAAAPLRAQDPPIRWGRISDAEVAATSDDPDAAALVLGDVGFDEITPATDGFRYRRRRHRRVKVLTEAGYAQGEFALSYLDDTSIRDVKGQTFVPQPDGSMRRVDLERRSIREEQVRDGVREVRFSMPALAPGAIFEVEYTYESDNFVALPPWYFQSDEPTVVSEYRVSVPGNLAYVTLRQGRQIRDHPAQVGRTIDGQTTEVRWSATDLPALRDEPYTTTEEDYTVKLALQLSKIVYPGGFSDDVLKTWATVAQTLDAHEAFGARLQTSRLRRSVAAEVQGAPDERARGLYDLVRTQYVWNGRGGVFADRDLNDVIEAKGGSAPELVLLLAALLREAGVDATPALLSSRANGRPVEDYPIVTQFDEVVVHVRHAAGSSAFLDPTDPHRPYGVLPVEALNGRAWLVDRDRPRWVDVAAPRGTSTTSFIEATLTTDARLAGTLQLRLTGYDAQNARSEIGAAAADAPARAAEAAETLAEATDAPEGFDVEVVTVEGVEDPAEPLRVEATFDTGAGEVVADEIYLTPFILMQLDENPFERPTRSYPVDFAYPFERTYVASISLPEGYEAAEVPPPVRLVTPGRAVSYSRVVGAEPGRLLVRAVLTVSEARVPPAEYPALRRLYDEIVAAEAEAVVLTRAATPPAAADTAADPAPPTGDSQ